MKLKIDFLLKHTLLLGLLICFSNTLLAQRTIKGTVIDAENSEPLIGASVIAVGTSKGTITDFDGTYSLEVPAECTELEFSYTGYANQKIALSASDVVDVSLAAGTILDEVVVVGYGSVRRKDATGAVSQVGEEDFNKGVITSPEQLIQGRASGVQITTSSGEPGAGVNVRIRGTSSVTNGNNPLFVVDGIPLSGADASAGGGDAGFGRSSARNPLNFLNPNDIASIDILKDASATAIYGSRGANGVIIITTKSGKANRGVLDYSYSIGASNISKKYDLLSADEFRRINPARDEGGNTDWQDEIFRTGMTHNHNLSFGDGNEKGDYRFSLSYLDQEGIIETSGIKRLSGRFNGSRKFIDDKLTLTTNFTVANTHDDNVPITENSGFEGDLLAAALKSNPTLNVRNANDTLIQISQSEPNPVAMLEYNRDYTNTVRALGNISANYAFTDKFSFKTVVGFDRSFSDRRSAFSRDLFLQSTAADPATGLGGRLYLLDVELDNKLWENYFTYTDKISDNVSFTGLVGYSYQEFNRSEQGLEMTNFSTSDLDLMINNYASADARAATTDQPTIVPSFSSQTKDELQSFFGRVNLGFNDKYLITASVRADGSTRFGEDNKYGIFPSFAFKWRLIEESFVPEIFDDLGLRLGWGLTGNQEIPHNRFSDRLRFQDWDINSGGGIDGGGLASEAFLNNELKWESTSQFNVGIDFAFIDYKLSGSLEFYRKNTNDLLIQLFAAQPAVTPYVFENLDADVINQGVELGLNYVAVDKKDFKWDVNFNIAYNDNKVENLVGFFDTGEINGQGLTGAFVQRIQSGQPLFAYFLREFGGFDAEGNSLYPEGDFQQFVGKSPLPKVTTGLTNTFTFGNLDVNFFLSGQFGQYIYSNTENAFFTRGALSAGRNVTKDVPDNGEGALNAPDVSTRFLHNGSFVRLQNLSIGYNIPLAKGGAIRQLRIYATGQNLFVLTGYNGQDPEVDVNKSLDGIPSAGIDYTAFPRARTFTLGANVSF